MFHVAPVLLPGDDLENAEATITNESPGSDIFKLATNPFTGAEILARSESQTLVVEFKPTATGPFAATLTLKGKNMTSTPLRAPRWSHLLFVAVGLAKTFRREDKAKSSAWRNSFPRGVLNACE